MAGSTAQVTAQRFDLKPHPFDGWFSAIESQKEGPARFHYLTEAGKYAAWHRLPGQLLFSHIDGASLTVQVSSGGRHVTRAVLGGASGSSTMIEAGDWRRWESTGQWSLLIASTQSPEQFFQWQLAPDNWYPH